MVDDPTLLRRFVEERREKEFAELVNRHLGLVYRAALRRANGDTHLAEDIAQQVFTKLATDAAKIQEHPLLAGWLYITTRHTASTVMRAEQRRLRREQEAHAMNELTEPNNPNADWERIHPELDRVMDELPELDRHAVLLRYFSNQPFAQIGAALRISENAARMRVDRALDRLRDLLAKRGIVSTSCALAALLVNEASAGVPNSLAPTITSTALLGGAAAAGSVGFIAFMSTTKMLATTAALLCLITGVVVHQENKASRLQAAVTSEEQSNATLAEEVRQLQSSTRDTRRQLTSTNEQNETLENKTADSAVTTTNRRKRLAGASHTALRLHEPEYQKVWLASIKNNFGNLYGRLYRKLGLTPAQIEGFENAMIVEQQEYLDLWASLHEKTGDLNAFYDSAYAPLKSKVREQLKDSLRKMIGDSGVTAFSEYADQQKLINASAPFIKGLVKDLFYTDVPLTAGQVDTLYELFTRNAVKNGNTTNFEWLKILEQAQNFMKPLQTYVFKMEMQKVREVNAMNRFKENLANSSP